MLGDGGDYTTRLDNYFEGKQRDATSTRPAVTSWKVGATDRDADPVAFNALRFAAKAEAEAYAADLFGRWLSCRRTEVHESTDPVNYSFVDGKLSRLEGGV